MAGELKPVVELPSGDRYRSSDRPDATCDDDDSSAPEFSEDALADAFSSQHADDWLYVAAWNLWLAWSGKSWQPDETGNVREQVRLVCREAARVAGDPHLKRRLASAASINAVERIARRDPRHTATAAEWDADPEVLNTPAGVIDLRSGKLHRHCRDDRMMRLAGASRSGQCPFWLRFLEQITNGDTGC